MNSIRLLTILIGCCLSFSWHKAASAEDEIVVGELGKAIADHLALLHDRLGFSGTVLVSKDGEIVAAVAEGSVSHDTDQELTVNSLFEIASCTKSFTAVAVMQLAEAGKLSLDDSISKSLPAVPENCQEITIRHLLAHTSGIPGTNTRLQGSDIAAAVASFLKGGPKHPPGSRFEYWNQGYSLLSEIIARVSGQTYTDYMKTHVFKPSGMKSSCFTGDVAPENCTVATGQSSRGPQRTALEHPYGSYGFQYRGMGGLVTNVMDLWQWDRALHDAKILKPESLNEMIDPESTGRGLGWTLKKDPTGKATHGHNGIVRGFFADMRRIPSIDGAVFVLTNQDVSFAANLAMANIQQILFGETVDSKIPRMVAADFPSQIAGQYLDNRKRKLVIQTSGPLPSIRIHWGGPVTSGVIGLDEQGQHNLYLLSAREGVISFKLDTPLAFEMENGRATSVSLMGVTPPLKFRR